MVKWNDELYHYGIPRRSGRYKWGSGKNPYHHGEYGTTKKAQKYSMQSEKALAKGKEHKASVKMSKAISEQRLHTLKNMNIAEAHNNPLSSGKNYNKTQDRHKKEWAEFDKKYNPDEMSKSVEQSRKTGTLTKKQWQYMDDYDALESRMKDELITATIKDIGFKNVENGRRLFKKYEKESIGDPTIMNIDKKYKKKATKEINRKFKQYNKGRK